MPSGGGLPPSTNRTTWPITGGAIAIQPGWYTNHATAYFYVNLGLGTDGPGGGPPNMSFPMVPIFEIIGPDNGPYPGTFCLPQVPLPVNVKVNVGDLATIQVVETAQSGAALYNVGVSHSPFLQRYDFGREDPDIWLLTTVQCVDIIFALPENVAEVNATNCFNSSDISFKDPFVNASTPTLPANASASDVFSCPQCPACPSNTATATPSSCPKSNGEMGTAEGLGIGFPLGVLALGILGL
jgi:hypothetical protein